MNLINELIKVGADSLLVRERVSDIERAYRMDICLNCDFIDAENMRCKVCTCFLQVKTGAKTNWNPKKLRGEITHCPKGFWDDIEIANEYRKLDGLEPIVHQ